MFKILGAKNRRKNLHKHPGPPFQIREGPGSFSNAKKSAKFILNMSLRCLGRQIKLQTKLKLRG